MHLLSSNAAILPAALCAFSAVLATVGVVIGLVFVRR